MRTLELRNLMGIAIALAIIFGVSPPSTGAVTIKKNISKDTVWRAKNSPYVVKESFVLEEGATLKIERGVRVELAAGKKIQVRGKLLAIGSPEKPIVFTARTDEPWETIYFTDFSDDAVFSADGRYRDGCIMKHCIIEKGHGIFIRFGAPLITECEIRNNLSSGIRVEFGSPRILRNHIWSNSTLSESASGNGGGIIAYTDKDTLIAGNTVNDNVSDGGRDGGGGIYAYAIGDARISVENNILFGNKSSRYGGGIYAYNSVLTENILTANEAVERGGGIYAVESTLAGNIVQSNKAEHGGGVYAESSEVKSNLIARNIALGPDGGGLYYFGSGRVRDNSLVSNSAVGEGECGGIYVSGNPQISANNLLNNSGYALYVANMAAAPEVLASENFWGAVSEKNVLDLTFDWLDDATAGLADYTPHLEKMSPTAPLPPPFNLTATASESGITLSWDEPAGAAAEGHRIYVGAKSGYPYDRVVETGPETGYELKGLKVGGEYWLAVSACQDVNGKKVETGFSEEVHILFTGSEESVTRPKNLSPENEASGVSKRAVLTASRPATSDGVVASRWQVSAFPNDFTALIVDTAASGDRLSKLDISGETLASGREYFWRVAYRTASGNWSDWSEPTSFSVAAGNPSILSGPITSAARLEKRYSPYRMTGNTLITPAGFLEIEPGVEILAAPGINLMVRGKLVARGTESEPIVFTRGSSEKWGRIIFTDESENIVQTEGGEYMDGCILERCTVEYGKGILIESAAPLIKDCSITHNDGSGVTVRQGGSVIAGNDIHHNAAPTNGGGIYAYTNDIIYVTLNKIHDNRAGGGGGGVYAYGYMNTSTIRVEDNEIFSNEAEGDGGGVYLSRSSAIGNTIESNRAGGDGGGVYATFGRVDANELRGNLAASGGGIFAERNSTLTRNFVTSNRASSGFGGGVYINFWGTSVENEEFTGNTVTRNLTPDEKGNGGVFIVGYLFFEQNNIHGNAGSQLYNGNESESKPLFTPQCYWGAADKGAISRLILDGHDDPQLGKVTFEPYSREPIRFD